MTPSYRNVFDTCLYTRNYFCQVTVLFGDCSGAFLCLGFHRPLCRFAALGQFGSLINQELSMYPIRTVFNYSANFNVVEETDRKQLISPKSACKTRWWGGSQREGYQLCSLSWRRKSYFPRQSWQMSLKLSCHFNTSAWTFGGKEVRSLCGQKKYSLSLDICPF